MKLNDVEVIRRQIVEDTVEQCNHCYKWYPKSELKYARHDMASDIELLCEVDREELDVVILKGDVV